MIDATFHHIFAVRGEEMKKDQAFWPKTIKEPRTRTLTHKDRTRLRRRRALLKRQATILAIVQVSMASL